MKLEGRDTDHCDGRKLSVHEQVSLNLVWCARMDRILFSKLLMRIREYLNLRIDSPLVIRN